LVDLGDGTYYRGHTIKVGDARLEEHKLKAMTNPTSRFHKKLAITDFKHVTIQVTETRCVSNRCEAEKHEMVLLDTDGLTLKMLNTRTRAKEVQEIEVAEVKPITEEKFEELAKSKRIRVNITVDKKIEIIELRYTHEGKRQGRK
jgi:hypothetical protein